jgi:hypothetical protein
MTITSLSDLYFISLGLFSYNILFEILSDTSIIYLPIIMIIYEALSDGFESSKNMSDTASTLKSMEVRFFIMVIGYSLAVVPVHKFSLDGVSQYTRQCNADGSQQVVQENMQDLLNTSQFDNMNDKVLTAKDMLVNVSGVDIEIPVLLKMTLKLGTGVGLQGVKRLPCTINLVGISDQLLSAQIGDNYLKMETKQFIEQCYYRAKNMAITNQDTNIEWVNDSDSDDQPWPGHHDFMNNSYYGNESLGMVSNVVLNGYENYYEEGKKPTCREWWEGKGAGKEGVTISDPDISLKQRLIKNMDSDLVSDLKIFTNFIYDSSEEDQFLKAYYFNPYNFTDILSAETKDYGNESEGASGWINDKISRLLGTAGMIGDAVPSYAGASLIQLAAPIAKGVIIMVILSLLPIAFVVAKYSFGFIVSVHFFLFSVLLWPYLWDLAILAQQSYVEETISDSTVPLWSMITQPNVMLISKKLTDVLFLGFPALLTSLLTVAGMSGGQALSSMSSSPGGDVGSAGNSGGKNYNPASSKGQANIKAGGSRAKKGGAMAKKVATKMATKGMG